MAVALLGQIEPPSSTGGLLQRVAEAQLPDQTDSIGRDEGEERDRRGVAKQLDVAPLRLRQGLRRGLVRLAMTRAVIPTHPCSFSTENHPGNMQGGAKAL